ncbi:MAG: 1-(5-phosphoribosyl)-5-amino-4-imidazole-carboxylate carboxylase, partial [Acidimicrobiales bacterium]
MDGVRSGAVAPDDAVRRLRRLPYTDHGFAKVDHHRALRQGMAEAVYALGKSPEECAAIVTALRDDGGAGP